MSITDNYTTRPRVGINAGLAKSYYDNYVSAPNIGELTDVSNIPDIQNLQTGVNTQLNTSLTGGLNSTPSFNNVKFDNGLTNNWGFRPNLSETVQSAVNPGTSKLGGGKSFWDGTKEVLKDNNIMRNIAGIGSLGLGLANYFAMKPMYEAQLKGLKQNIAFAKQDQERRNRTASNFDRALR